MKRSVPEIELKELSASDCLFRSLLARFTRRALDLRRTLHDLEYLVVTRKLSRDEVTDLIWHSEEARGLHRRDRKRLLKRLADIREETGE
jgi:hypothetical protein